MKLCSYTGAIYVLQKNHWNEPHVELFELFGDENMEEVKQALKKSGKEARGLCAKLIWCVQEIFQKYRKNSA